MIKLLLGKRFSNVKKICKIVGSWLKRGQNSSDCCFCGSLEIMLHIHTITLGDQGQPKKKKEIYS